MTLLHEILDRSAALYPANVALRHRVRDFSYEEVRRRSECVASGLVASGIARGDRVVVYLHNRPEVVELALACSRLGAIFVPANPVLRMRQLCHILNDSGARMLVLPYSALYAVSEILEACPALRNVVLTDMAIDAPPTPFAQVCSYDELIQSPTPRAPVAVDRDAAAILYTSGSTGRPKGVVISHRNLVSGAQSVASYLGNTAEDRLLAALPLSFDYGFSQVTTAFHVGACAVLTNFSMAAALIQEVVANDITGIAGVPTMWAHLADNEWPEKAVSTVRYLTNSGGALPTQVVVKLRARLRETRIFCMYGLTEAFRSTYLEPEQLATRAGSIGKAIPNQEVLVLRPDGTHCDAEEVGELVHRGSLVTLGYWNEPELTHERFRPMPGGNAGLTPEYAVFSGDLVRADSEGYLYFVGRKDQQIKTLGYRVSPSEIEEVVAEVPGVVEAVVLGVPHDVFGQRIVLALVTTPPEPSKDPTQFAEAIIEVVRQHARMYLPAYMVPTQILGIAAIPRNANGKPDRAALQVELWPRMGVDDEAPHYNRIARD